MLSCLPKLTAADIDYCRDRLIPDLVERPTGAEDLEEGLRRLCPELFEHNYYMAEAIARAANMVTGGFQEQIPEGTAEALKLGVCVGIVSVLSLVSRKLEEQELQRRLNVEGG